MENRDKAIEKINEELLENFTSSIPVSDLYLESKTRKRSITPMVAEYSKCKKDAVFPSKAIESDSGYDITIIDKVRQFGNTTLYGTGLKVKPYPGTYFELVARSSISKTGYILKNSVGIIDQSYRGEILVALEKINHDMPDIELPCRIAQLIPRKIISVNFIEVESFDETERGEKGFGSTG